MYSTEKLKETKCLSRNYLTKSEKEVLLTTWKNRMKHAGQKLTNLNIRNRNTAKINYKIHYLLCDPFTFNNAYSKISKNKGALTLGVDRTELTMKFYQKKEAEIIAMQFKTWNYKWSPTRRTLIPKPGKTTMRPIDTPTQKDRIAQEAIRGILEAIYEPIFSEFENQNNHICTNYGFRPRKSTKDAIETIKQKVQSCTFAIEGDIVGAYNNVNHKIMISILKRKIKDKKFLKVISDLLKSGIMKKDSYKHSLVGTPQGGIVSPILFHISMFELDNFVLNNIINPLIRNNINRKKKQNPDYVRTYSPIKKLRDKIHNCTDPKERISLKKQMKIKVTERFQIPSFLPESLPTPCVYTRYAGNWIIFVNKDLKTCYMIKNRIERFLNNELKLELDSEKTLVTNTSKEINFLGFQLITKKTNSKITIVAQKSGKSGKIRRFKKRTTSRKTRVYPDKPRIIRNLINKGFMNPKLQPIGNAMQSLLTPYEIVLKYSQMQIGLHNYYCDMIDTKSLINFAFYILQYSCA